MEKAFAFADLHNEQGSFEIYSNCFEQNIILQRSASASKQDKSYDCSKGQEINEDHFLGLATINRIQMFFKMRISKICYKKQLREISQRKYAQKIKQYAIILLFKKTLLTFFLHRITGQFIKSQKIIQFDYKYPRETKNLPKVYTRALIFFINQTIKQSLKGSELKHLAQNSQIKSFIKLCPERAGRERLMKFLNSGVGKLFGEEFFGNCQWVYPLTMENKAQIQSYFRYNNIYYNEIMHPLKKQLKL